MAKEHDIPEDQLDLLKSAFGKTSKKEKVKVENPKEECPYCGKEFVSVARHLNYCDQNPENLAPAEFRVGAPRAARTTRRKVYVEEEIIEQPQWNELIIESVNTLKSLTEYLKEIKENGVKVKLMQ